MALITNFLFAGIFGKGYLPKEGDINIPIFIGTFWIYFFLLTYRRIRYIHTLSKAINVIASGNLEHKVKILGKDELTVLAGNINRMVEELKEIKEKEQKVEEAKNELITNISHDIRTPLTSIIGYANHIMETYKDNEQLIKYIKIIDEKAQRLSILIDDLFEFAILTGSEVKLNKSRVSLVELTRQVIEEMMPLGVQNHIMFDLAVPTDELIVDIDAVKFARVFENIISNAIKYSYKPGSINISLSRESDHALVCFHNRGIALKEDELTKVFDRFYRSDMARSPEKGGTGIGLSIAKSIVELHQGKIWATCTGEDIYFMVSLCL